MSVVMGSQLDDAFAQLGQQNRADDAAKRLEALSGR